MSGYQVEWWNSSAAIRAGAARWDDLWRRSGVTVPIAQAEPIAQWIDRCASRRRVSCFTLVDGERLIAALPLVGQPLGHIWEVGGMPNDPWSNCGELLVDQDRDPRDTTDALLEALARVPWSMLRLSPIPLESERWQLFQERARAHGWLVDAHPHYTIGTVEIGRVWETFERSYSSNHRRYLRKARKRAEAMGEVRLRIETPLDPAEIAEHLKRGFSVEDQSWKGTAGTSVLRAPGMLEYYRRQAEHLAERGQLRLVFLDVAGEPIAFELGYVAKRTYFSPKVGYNDRFAALCPGQLLRDLLFRTLHEQDEIDRVDFWGPLSPATARWNTGEYVVGRLALAPPRLEARLLFQAYQSGTELAHRFQQWRDAARRRRATVGGGSLVAEAESEPVANLAQVGESG